MSDAQNHTLPVRVYYEDTDAAGIVYHTSYLRFAERGRTEMLRDAGFAHAEIFRETGTAFAVTSLDIKFKIPAKLDDLLIVKTRITEMRSATMTMEQDIYRDDRLLTQIIVHLACIDRRGKAARLPEQVRALFK